MIDGFCDLGVMKRDETSFRLLYTARVQFEPVPESEPEAGDLLRARLVRKSGPIAGRGGAAFAASRPEAPSSKRIPKKAIPSSSRPIKKGRIDQPGVAEGRTGLLVKWIEKAPGTFEGKSYAEVRHYATLTVAPAGKPLAAAANAAPFALLPEAVNSFGGAVLGDWLYVYSGHIGDTHKYDNSTTSKHFRRLNLKDRQTWEELPCGPPLQGVTLVSGGGQLYRIGGMSVHQAPESPPI